MERADFKTCFIVNLHSGKRPHLARRAIAFAQKQRHACWVTERRAHARELAQTACKEGYERVVAVGGDGTMNEVASVLINTPVTLALVPAGSGNGLARHLGIFGSERHVLDILETGVPRVIDAGIANGNPFFTVGGVGFEADVSAGFGEFQRGLPGYLRSAARRVFSYPEKHYTLVRDGETEEVSAFTIAIANANQYGNRARIAPFARLDDGRLDAVFIPHSRWYQGADLLWRLFFGNVLNHRGVRHHLIQNISVSSDAPIAFHTDGEIHLAVGTVNFAVVPRCLKVLVPASSHRVDA